MREAIVDWLSSSWVPGYAQMLALAFLVASLWMGWRARAAGLSGSHALGLCVWTTLGAIVGARLLQALHQLPVYLADPGRLLDPFRGGLVFYGGAIGGALAAAVYLWRRRLPALRYLDLAMPPVGLAIAIGRIGCLLNGCCFGQVSQRPWAVVYPPGSFPFRAQVATGQLARDASASLPVHPSPVYESLLGLALAGLALWMLRRPDTRPGHCFVVVWMVYAAGRFVLELVRGDLPWRGAALGPLSTSQGISLMILAAGMVALSRAALRRHRATA